QIILRAPFATPRFTLQVEGRLSQPPRVETGRIATTLEKTARALWLKGGAWHQSDTAATLCFNLSKGQTTVTI
ncbi:MAG TPA: hypothetical protein PLO68_20510, partial [Sedimentisphaerales bacterium]|nr:hypothetical protein [Sedimentisphaerales bacterium]